MNCYRVQYSLVSVGPDKQRRTKEGSCFVLATDPQMAGRDVSRHHHNEWATSGTGAEFIIHLVEERGKDVLIGAEAEQKLPMTAWAQSGYKPPSGLGPLTAVSSADPVKPPPWSQR